MATIPHTFHFGTKPFTGKIASGKQFKSSDFIYGKLELPSTVEEFFNIPERSSHHDYPTDVLIYKVTIEKDGESSGSSNAWIYTKITPEQKKNNFFRFDVLPEPSEATTMICGLADYGSNVGAAPLYMMFDRNHFPENGIYKVKIEIKYWSFDPYNPETPTVEEEWTSAPGEFEFEFNTKDLKNIQANGASAAELVKENARVKAMEARGLPEQWNWKETKFTLAYQEQELKDMFLVKEGDECNVLKMVVYPVKAPSWIIEKNAYDIPLIRWYNQHLGFFAENKGRYFYISGGLRQQYQGGGTYGEIFYQWRESIELSPKFILPELESEKGAKKKSAKTTAVKNKK